MESRKKRHQHEIKAAESLDAAQNKPANGKRNKKHGKRNRMIAVILAIFVIIGVVFMMRALLTDKNAALNPQDTTFKTVNIPAGSTASQMGQTLQNKKVIKNGKNFYKYAMSQGAEKLQAGTYQLSPSQTTQLIFAQMTSGPGAAPKLP